MRSHPWCLAVLILHQTNALAQDPVNPPHPACPERSGRTWLEYLLTGPTSQGKDHYFQVRFDKMAKIPDPYASAGPLGTVWKGSCYLVVFELNSSDYAKSRWRSSGTVKGNKEAALQYTPVKLADPKQYQFGINGRKFGFDEAGRVYDDKLGHIGSLHCPLLYPVPCIWHFADSADAKRLTGR